MIAALTNKAQEMAQSSTGRSLDAVAFIGGIAVWQEWVPLIVGIFTCAWLGFQMFMSIPKIVETWRWIKKKCRGE